MGGVTARREAGGSSAVAAPFSPPTVGQRARRAARMQRAGRASTIVVLGHFRGRAKGDGGALDAHFAHVWRMRDGKAVHFTNYVDTMTWARAMGKA